MDIRSLGPSVGPKEGSEQLDQLRKSLGEGFTDKPVDKKKKNEMGKDDFMKLMSAQLKYQDPISPMKNEEMAAQLAQFSALEQMFNVNQNLEKMAAGQKPQENVLAASLIGKKVVTDSSKLHLEKDKSVNINFDLPGNALKGSVAVVNAKGEVVREISLAGAKKGLQSINWDGKSDKGQMMDPGEYSFRVTATDKDEKPIVPSLASNGIVTGVSFDKGRPLLLVGDKKLSLDSVSQIEEATSADIAKASAEAKTKKEGVGTKPEAKTGAKTSAPASAQATANTEKTFDADKQKDLLPAQTRGTMELSEAPQEAAPTESEVAQNAAPNLRGTSLWNPND